MRHCPRGAALLLVLLSLALPAGCGGNPAPASSSTADTAETYVCTAPDGEPVLQASAERPQLSDSLSEQAAQTIERYYDAVYADARAQWQAELSDFALSDYALAEQTGIPFRPYSIEESCTVVRSDASYYSVVRVRQSYTGGAQEEQTVTCEVFDASSGTLLALEDLFVPGSDYAELLRGQLVQALAARSQAEPGVFFDDAQAHLDSAFATGSFSLSDDRLTFVYPTYTLAPSSAGVIFLDIPLSALQDCLREA